MRVAVFSDTHGRTDGMLEAVRRFQPDAVCHLGDYDRDAVVLRKAFPGLPVHSVCGNCDYAPLAPVNLVIQLGPVRAFLTHGHLYGVDFSNADRLVYAAQEQCARLALFGHTHRPFHEDYGGVKVVNPGTAGKGRSLTWAMLDIRDNGGIGVDFHTLPVENEIN